MSASNTAQPTLPEPQAAINTLFSNVSAEVFFGKLASAGIQPQNQKEASDLLDLAGRLRLVEQDPRAKQASASPYAQMVTELDSVLARNGLDGNIKQAAVQEHEIAVKQAAARLAQDPEIFNAVLSVKAAQAAALTQRPA